MGAYGKMVGLGGCGSSVARRVWNIGWMSVRVRWWVNEYIKGESMHVVAAVVGI